MRAGRGEGPDVLKVLNSLACRALLSSTPDSPVSADIEPSYRAQGVQPPCPLKWTNERTSRRLTGLQDSPNPIPRSRERESLGQLSSRGRDSKRNIFLAFIFGRKSKIKTRTPFRNNSMNLFLFIFFLLFVSFFGTDYLMEGVKEGFNRSTSERGSSL